MGKDKALAVFEEFKIRRTYDEKAETWFFSVVDIVAALIQQPDYQAARNYWKFSRTASIRKAVKRLQIVTG